MAAPALHDRGLTRFLRCSYVSPRAGLRGLAGRLHAPILSRMGTALVVEDDETVGDVVAAYLQRAGMAVLRAADGIDALTVAAVQRPDIVVLDLMLPGIDGLEVCR